MVHPIILFYDLVHRTRVRNLTTELGPVYMEVGDPR